MAGKTYLIAALAAGSLVMGAASAPVATAADSQLVDCAGGGALPFSLGALNGPRGAEAGSTSESLALRTFLASNPALATAPKSGWIEVTRKTVDANDYVRYLNTSGSTTHTALIFRVAGRSWQLHPTFPRICPLRRMASDTRASTPWNVIPRRLPRSPRSRYVWIQLTETNCAGGRRADGRVRLPVVDYSARRVVIVADIVPPKGTNSCQFNPPTYVKVPLPGPIGSRALVDGGSVPTNSRLNRTQIKRIRARRSVKDQLIFRRTKKELCRDKADGSLTIPGLRLTTRLQRRLDARASKCPD
ncbi:MAG: hypothetical protein ACPGWS_06600 [Solirubrobacterales bacterium]